ncbi:PhoH-like protein [uncultured archaeon]|nr:PhoH-like protein [uncultured archaeon]
MPPSKSPQSIPMYHHILMPLTDVYALGGPDVFTELARKKERKNEKNLIVLPMEMVSKMMEPQKHMGQLGLGGVDALDEIVKSEHEYFDDNARVYHVSPGLDVAVYIEDDTSVNSVPLTKTLAEKVKAKCGGISKIITTNPSWTLRYQVQGYNVERPGFLLVDSSVVEKGLINGSNSLLQKLYENKGVVPLDVARDLLKLNEDNGENLYQNQFIRFMGNASHVYARVTGDLIKINGRVQEEVENQRVEFIGRDGVLDMMIRMGEDTPKKDILGISPWDEEQYLAAQYCIIDPKMQIGCVSGGASSGKTLLGYVLSAFQVLKHPDKSIRERRGIGERGRMYDQLILLKSTDFMGGDHCNLGFLPGDLLEKIIPHLQPFNDAHKESPDLRKAIKFEDMFVSPKENKKESEEKDPIRVDGCYLPEYLPPVELTTSAYFRGRSFKRKLLVSDEFQNFTPYEAKTIIERVGEGSKLIAMGDPNQFDNPHCSRDINGFTFAVKTYLKHPLSSLVKLTHSYRTEIAEIATKTKVYSR